VCEKETERRGMGVSPMISLRKALRRGPHHTGRMPVLPLFIHPLSSPVEKGPGGAPLDSSLRWNDDFTGPFRSRHPCEGRGPEGHASFQWLLAVRVPRPAEIQKHSSCVGPIFDVSENLQEIAGVHTTVGPVLRASIEIPWSQRRVGGARSWKVEVSPTTGRIRVSSL